MSILANLRGGEAERPLIGVCGGKGKGGERATWKHECCISLHALSRETHSHEDYSRNPPAPSEAVQLAPR